MSVNVAAAEGTGLIRASVSEFQIASVLFSGASMCNLHEDRGYFARRGSLLAMHCELTSARLISVRSVPFCAAFTRLY